MATARACGCSVCDVRGKRCCLSRWSGQLSCLAGRSCCSCLPSSTTDPTIPPSDIATLLHQQEITLQDLDKIIPIIQDEVNRLNPSAGSSSQAPISQSVSNMLSQWDQQKQICSSFINSLPKELTAEVATNGRSLFLSLLTDALSGLEGVRWLGVGFAFIGWSLDNINNIIQNRADCIKILRDSLRLLRNTKEIWELTKHDDGKIINEDLQDSVEKAFRCAIFCTSNLQDQPWILSIVKATSVKEAITTLADEISKANIQNTEFMGRHNLRTNYERQITFPQGHGDIVLGGQDVIQEAVTYLKSSSDEIMAVCLHGMGGIGKSFLGLKIFAEFQKSKYRDCRVELQLEPMKEEQLCDVQKQIVEKVCKHALSKISNLTDGQEIMQKELKQTNDPIFLYVDNVLEHQYLSDLLPNATSFPKGSRILITSRGEYIKRGITDLGITDHNYRLIEVRKLEMQQAQQLLWEQLKSDRDIISSEVDQSLEKRVLELCDGLPLALVVVGKYIANENGIENAEVWREVVNAMQEAEPLDGTVNEKLYSRIMFSIQNLHPDAVKQTFLDTIFSADSYYLSRWENIERLVIRSKYLKVLCERGLLRKKSEKGLIPGYNSHSTAEIHDVIMAMGKRMVESDKQELRIRGMVKFEEHKNALSKVVALDGVTVDAHLLNQMPLLRLLKDVQVRGECQKILPRHLRVVHGLRCSTIGVFDWSVCTSLKVIGWGYSLMDNAGPNVSNLEVFNHDKISMGCEVLALYRWSQLKDVDVIETFTCLKELRLSSCTEIESIPQGISRLTGLKKLQLSFCTKIESIPQGISRLTGLEVLDLRGCESVQSLPDGLTSLTGLAMLDLTHCGSLQNILEGIGNLRGVTDLQLTGCRSLEYIPEGATNLMSGLTELSLRYCSRIKYLPEGVTRLTGLRKLDLSACRSLRSLPEGVSDLTGLTSLSLVICKRLQALPEGIASLSRLSELKLNGCSNLQSQLPKELSCLTGLTSLGLAGCRSLDQASLQKLGFMTWLRQLDLSGCESLQFLPDEVSKLTGLDVLNLSSCKSLHSIEGVTTLTALRILGLTECIQLQFLPEGCTRLINLTHIYLSRCRSLKSIPEAILRPGHLMGLHWHLVKSRPVEEKARNICLELWGCESLKSLPNSIGNLTQLERLDLSNCTSLESLPEGIRRLSNLARLSLLGCRSLQCPPGGLIGSLTGLTELKLGKCSMPIQPLLEEVSCSMTSLRELELAECEDLQSLPQGITSLISLEVLSLSGCQNLQLLPQGMANWTGLTSLDLSGCKSLQSLPEELTTLTALSNLLLSGCARLRSLPQGIFTSLAGLKNLSMSGCGGLQHEESQGITMLTGLTSLDLSESEHLLFPLSEQGLAANLTSLKMLNLSGCRSLQSLPEGVAALTNLDWLVLSGCASLQSLSNLGATASRQLWRLDLGGCGNLDQPSVWETILSFDRCLCNLVLSGWENMKALPEEMGSLERLRELDLSKCSSLLSLPESVTNLTNLQKSPEPTSRNYKVGGAGRARLVRMYRTCRAPTGRYEYLDKRHRRTVNMNPQ